MGAASFRAFVFDQFTAAFYTLFRQTSSKNRVRVEAVREAVMV
jgi:hypothetical protein